MDTCGLTKDKMIEILASHDDFRNETSNSSSKTRGAAALALKLLAHIS